MKKITAFLLAILTILCIFAGCSEKTEKEPETQQTQDANIAEETKTEEPAEQVGTTEPEAEAPTEPEKQPENEPSEPKAEEPAVQTEIIPIEIYHGEDEEDEYAPKKPVELKDETPTYRKFDNKFQEALVTTAQAYLARGEYAQYDDTRLIASWNDPATYRWQRNQRNPEDYTSQYTGYTNCAAFTYDVYFHALDFDIKYWSTAQLIKASKEELVYVYYPTGNETDAQKAEIKKQFLDALVVGDIIVRRYNDNKNGHAMLYIGNGEFIHSTGSNYDYSGKKDVKEASGTVQLSNVETYFDGKSTNAYFFNCTAYGIVRPLNIFKGDVPAKSVNRAKNLQGVVVQKLSTAHYGQTVDLGDEITFTYVIENRNNWKVSLDIEDCVPDYTEYVSGGDSVTAGKMKWKVTVPRNKSVEISYTVKVKNDPSVYGKKIDGRDGYVGGVPVKCPGVFVKPTLSEEQQQKIATAVGANLTSTLSDVDLANKIYTEALGKPLLSGSLASIINSVYTPCSETHAILNEASGYITMVVPGLYGGYYVAPSNAFDGDRVRGPQSMYLRGGDILIVSDLGGQKVEGYMMLSAGTMFNLTPGKVGLVSRTDTNAKLEGAIAWDKFIVLRPTMAG